MALATLRAQSAPASAIVEAFLAARAEDERIDQADGPNDTFEARMAQFAQAGARHYAMAWGIESAEHAALVALLTADRLQNLIDGYSRQNDRGEKVVTFGAEELYEVKQIKDALIHLWRHLNSCPSSRLRTLATDLDLIDRNGNPVG